MGQLEATLGVVEGFEDHIAAKLQTAPEVQAAFDKQVGFEIQLEFGDQVGSRVQPMSGNQVELEKQRAFDRPVDEEMD